MRSDLGCDPCTSQDVALILSKTVLFPLLDLAFLIWIVVLLWQQKFFLVQWNRLTDSQKAVFSGILVAWAALTVGVSLATHILLLPLSLDKYLIANPASFLVIWISSFCWVAHSNARPGAVLDSRRTEPSGKRPSSLKKWWSVRENRINFLSVFILVFALLNPRRTITSLVLFAALVIVVQVRLRVDGWVVALALRGHYKTPLRLNRIFQRVPGPGDSTEAWILSEAGRYVEAMACLKPLAFDKNDQPLLTSWGLYMYASTLLRNGDFAAAQDLFEAAMQEQQQELKEYFSLGLADSLLAQKRDVDRARTLIAQAISDRKGILPASWQNANSAHLTAFYAFALAACGERGEAEALLNEADAGSKQLSKRDRAGLMHITGLTWRALGDRARAKAALDEALALHPFGDIALRTRKKLAEFASTTEP